jgi:hypothetical protein
MLSSSQPLFRTLVDLPAPPRPLLAPSHRLLLMGSCFASHVGEQLVDALPEGQVVVNPFGVLYNPLSICRALTLLMEDTFPAERYIFRGEEGLWHSSLHSGDFSAPTREACVAAIEKAFRPAAHLLETVDMLCLTWGTAYVYEWADSHEVVGNCHKVAAQRFVTRRLSIDEIVEEMETLLTRLRQRRPQLQVVLTVSPYRYAKWGYHTSTLSKSVLHLAAERLTQQVEGVHYFPAYEIVMDELRDYRFYDDDMLHPSAGATRYVGQRFAAWAFSDRLREYAADRRKILQALRHRLLHPDSEEARRFRAHLEVLQREFQRKWET